MDILFLKLIYQKITPINPLNADLKTKPFN